MSDLATGYHLVLYAVLIVVAMPVLEWVESRRFKLARALRARREARGPRTAGRSRQESGG